MRVRAALIVMALWASPALAEFNDLEKRELAEEYGACSSIRAALIDLSEAAEQGADGPSRAAVSGAGTWLSTANNTCIQAMGWIFHVPIGATQWQNDSCLASRSAAMGCARERLTRLAYEIGQAENGINAYLPSAPAGVAAELTQAVADIDAAQVKLSGFDSALEYLEPFPVNFPRQFGPHGDYIPAQTQAWLTQTYSNQLVLQAWIEYRDGAGPAGIYLLVRSMSQAHDKVQHAWLLGARSGLTDTERGWSDIDRAFKANQLFTSPFATNPGAGFLFHNAYLQALKFFRTPVGGLFTDGWRAIEGWSYHFLNGGMGRERGF